MKSRGGGEHEKKGSRKDEESREGGRRRGCESGGGGGEAGGGGGVAGRGGEGSRFLPMDDPFERCKGSGGGGETDEEEEHQIETLSRLLRFLSIFVGLPEASGPRRTEACEEMMKVCSTDLRKRRRRRRRRRRSTRYPEVRGR
eukprot:761699-Hanusia_phi.AAC.2